MITANFTGNIGDHLKIYALTRTIAEKNGYEWGFNPVTSHDYYKGAEQMDFLEIDYGKRHGTPWGVIPEWVEQVVEEPKQALSFEGHPVNFHPFTPELFDIKDNTLLVVNCAQNFKYYEGKKESIKKWFKIRDNKKAEFEKTIKEYGLVLDENLCVLNARGGEYLCVKDFTLIPSYWEHAQKRMLEKNPRMQFICITDDVQHYSKLFKMPVLHFSIGCDYYILNHAQNIIISNSAFAMFPVWLNESNPFVIAPLYWARYNISNGYWGYAEINIPEWNWMNREGNFVSL